MDFPGGRQKFRSKFNVSKVPVKIQVQRFCRKYHLFVRFMISIYNCESLFVSSDHALHGTFPQNVSPPPHHLMNYIIEGVFILNKYASGSSLVEAQGAVAASGSRKRCRIMQRLAPGYGQAKKRRFYISCVSRLRISILKKWSSN